VAQTGSAWPSSGTDMIREAAARTTGYYRNPYQAPLYNLLLSTPAAAVHPRARASEPMAGVGGGPAGLAAKEDPGQRRRRHRWFAGGQEG
jgi:hypothetical protein